MDDCRCSITMEHVGVKKRDGVILDDVNLAVRHGEILALIGRNGAGKTTLLKALLGRISYEGRILFADPRGELIRRPNIGYVPQNLIFDHSTPMTTADLLCANLGGFPVWLGHSRAATARAEAMLERVGARAELLKKRLGSLSGGELQRVLLAFALEPLPDLLLLDEPVSAVDRGGIEVFYELVQALRKQYHMPVILVSHDLEYVKKHATTAAFLDKTILVRGTVGEVLADPLVRKTFGFGSVD